MRLMALRFAFWVGILGLLFAAVPAFSNETAQKIVLAGSQDTKNSFHGRWLTLIYTELFRRLGYALEYRGYPSKRASRMSDAGHSDGEINRVAKYQSSHPNLIRVDESHFPTTISAYAVKPGISLTGWQSLKNADYRVDYRRGTEIVASGLALVVAPEKLSAITTTEQGLKRLVRGWTDIYVDVEDIVTEQLGRLRFSNHNAASVYKAGVLAEDSLHLFLHRKHAALAPKVAQVLRTMKAEGLVEQYKQLAMHAE